jgi:hypothetical protein
LGALGLREATLIPLYGVFSAIPVDLFLNFKSAKNSWNKQLLYLYLGLSRERYHCAMAELQPAALFDFPAKYRQFINC